MPPDDRSPQFVYEAPQAITRGSFRLLLFLVATNTLLLGLFVLGPGIQNFVKQQWAEWKQQKVAAAAATQAAASAAAEQARRAAIAAKRNALLAEAVTYLAPPGKLIYDDSPSAATRPATNPADAAEWPGAAKPPECFEKLPLIVRNFSGADASISVPLFMHLMKATPNSPTMLVIVWSDARAVRLPKNVGQYGERRWSAMAVTASPTWIADQPIALTNFSWTQPEPRTPRRDPTKPPPPPPPPLPVPALKMFAAELDPNDGGVFVIPYDLNGALGRITGRLSASGLVDLTPDSPIGDGWKVGSVTNYR